MMALPRQDKTRPSPFDLPTLVICGRKFTAKSSLLSEHYDGRNYARNILQYLPFCGKFLMQWNIFVVVVVEHLLSLIATRPAHTHYTVYELNTPLIRSVEFGARIAFRDDDDVF